MNRIPLPLPALPEIDFLTVMRYALRFGTMRYGVVAFQDSQGKPSIRGWYVADDLSENWLAKKQKFRLFDRSELKDHESRTYGPWPRLQLRRRRWETNSRG